MSTQKCKYYQFFYSKFTKKLPFSYKKKSCYVATQKNNYKNSEEERADRIIAMIRKCSVKWRPGGAWALLFEGLAVRSFLQSGHTLIYPLIEIYKIYKKE